MEMREVAVVDGDGIGPEVCRAAIQVMDVALGKKRDFDWRHVPAGAQCFLDTGVALPQSTIETCANADAILLGAAGLPGVLYDDGTEAGQDTTLRLRFELDLFANVRPIKLFEGVDSPLKGDPNIDYVIVRENSEGLYAARGAGNALRDEMVSDTMIVTRKGVERIVRQAAEICMGRNGAPLDGTRRVTICDKSNVLRSYAFFRKVADEVLSEYPEIEVDYALVDALSMYLVTKPDYYDVIVTENMFGDILSDLGAATIGGLGLAGSSELGETRGLFQASHGSAPDIAGKGIANPIATILSGASMLEWLGLRRKKTDFVEAGVGIRQAVEQVLMEGIATTPDLGGKGTTESCVAAIVDRL